MKSRLSIFLVLSAFSICSAQSARSQQGTLLTLSQIIALPNVQGGFNHMSVDAKRELLFAAASTNKTLEIVDLKTGRPWRSLEGEKPAAARYAPEFNQLYVPRGQHLDIYNGGTFALVASIDLQSNLDELQYVAAAKRLYVGCMTSGKTGIAVISIPDGKLLGMISLPDKPQGIAAEQTGERLFANMPTLGQVAVMDGEKRSLVARWQLDGVQGNTPMGLDEANHRLFIGARHPAQFVVLNTTTGKTVASVSTDGDADDLFYDSARRRVYISCGEGFIDVVEQTDANRYALTARVPTAPGARTSTFSSMRDSLYVGVPRTGDHPAELRVYKSEK